MSLANKEYKDKMLTKKPIVQWEKMYSNISNNNISGLWIPIKTCYPSKIFAIYFNSNHATISREHQFCPYIRSYSFTSLYEKTIISWSWFYNILKDINSFILKNDDMSSFCFLFSYWPFQSIYFISLMALKIQLGDK